MLTLKCLTCGAFINCPLNIPPESMECPGIDEMGNKCGGMLIVYCGDEKAGAAELVTKIEKINQLFDAMVSLSKKMQAEAAVQIEDIYVICPFHNECGIKCYHSELHPPLSVGYTTCRHFSSCPKYNTRCVPI